jgi:hypothetical protein
MSGWNQIRKQQKELCDKLKVDWTPIDENSLIAFNDSLLSTIMPMNGLRHPKEGIIDGWYLWSGAEIPQDNIEFFKPLHVWHLFETRPVVLKYLGLPAGWRFQIDNEGYEDIWFDETILNI